MSNKEEMGAAILSEREYNEIKKDLLFLSALQAAGVDNWEWYGEAIDIYHEYLREAGYDVPE